MTWTHASSTEERMRGLFELCYVFGRETEKRYNLDSLR